MNEVDQNSVLKSQQDFLIPKASLIDGRTEQDMLSFMANFGSLINFYDRNNNKLGDWTPFLLKDPIFLLALISATNFKNLYRLYLNTCSKLHKNLYEEEGEEECRRDFNNSSATNSINQLFYQLTDTYLKVQKWAHYMQQSDNSYELKTYLIEEIETNYSTYLWALLAFQEQLSMVSIIKDVMPVHNNVRETFSGKIWQSGKNKDPYWEILGLDKNLSENEIFELSKISACEVFEGIQVVGDQLFPFFKKIIDYALVEFNSQKVRKSKFPDTILLRTFINLLRIQQNQLNSISQKHLEFYYKKILKQEQKLASPDHVFACAELANNNAVFTLPKDTLFDAGTDVNENQILFESTTDVTLNPAKIGTAFTLCKIENVSEKTESLYLREMKSPSEIKRNENGDILTWSTFGNTKPKDATPVALGFAFASPILFLREGARTINLTFTFDSYVDLDLFCKAHIYLSTKEDWLKIDNSFISYVYTKAMIDEESDASIIRVKIELDATLPSIEAFEENPDNISSEWPLFKIEFHEFKDLETPPMLTSLDIDVEVKELRTFQLYNDLGALSTEAPFQLFGSIPGPNSNFIIGSSEIFSKPLGYLEIELNWDNLPDDFKVYYDAYNKYLTKLEEEQSKPDSQPFFKRVIKLVSKIIWPFCKNKDEEKIYFENVPFQVDFKWLNDKLWTQLSMPKYGCNEEVEENFESKSNTNIDPVSELSEELFCVIDECLQGDKSHFRYTYNSDGSPVIIPCPKLQKTDLEYTETSTSGFMKIELVAPEYGFGNDIYAQVVSYIVLENAKYIVEKCFDKLILAPNVPFIPLVSLFKANYSTSYTYRFNKQENTLDSNHSQQLDASKEDKAYPYECYYYTPFKNFLVCNESIPVPDYTYNLTKPIKETEGALKASGLALYPAFKSEGALLLALEELIAPGELHMYFQLDRNYNESSAILNNKVTYAYMEAQGWNTLDVLSDKTNNFGCSGIIKVNVSKNISTTSYYMPEDKYWLSISVNEDLDSYSQTAYLNTNGFELRRSGDHYLNSTDIPKLESDAISVPFNAIPELASILQPFPSFGGKAAETETVANQRISTRLKTKDRVVSTSDFFSAIKQVFNDIYYSKTLYSRATNRTQVYLVKKVNNHKTLGAFMPLVTTCRETEVKDFLEERASGLSHIDVSNFQIEFVTVIATISVKSGFEFDGVMKVVNEGLMLYLSPWIFTDKEQVQIDRGISTAGITTIIKDFEGVDSVNKIQFETILNGNKRKHTQSFITPVDSKTLFVSSAEHEIKNASDLIKLVNHE